MIYVFVAHFAFVGLLLWHSGRQRAGLTSRRADRFFRNFCVGYLWAWVFVIVCGALGYLVAKLT